MGPDLTTVSRRFTQREILESIVFPSHVISSQYASKTVITSRGIPHVGIVAAGLDGVTVLKANGEKLVIPEDQIDEILPNKTSSMPTGLLDKLTLEEIADLFVYMRATPRQNLVRRKRGTTRK